MRTAHQSGGNINRRQEEWETGAELGGGGGARFPGQVGVYLVPPPKIKETLENAVRPLAKQSLGLLLGFLVYYNLYFVKCLMVFRSYSGIDASFTVVIYFKRELQKLSYGCGKLYYKILLLDL